jgi:hypothetical protein
MEMFCLEIKSISVLSHWNKPAAESMKKRMKHILFGTSLAFLVILVACNKQIDDPGYSYYVSTRTEIIDPTTGSIDIRQHNNDDRIVVRLDFYSNTIQVFNPGQTNALYHFSDSNRMIYAHSDSLYQSEIFELSSQEEFVISDYMKEATYQEYFISYHKKGAEDETDCNAKTYFVLSRIIE